MEGIEKYRKAFGIVRGLAFVVGVYSSVSEIGLRIDRPVGGNVEMIFFDPASLMNNDSVLDIRKLRVYDSKKGDYTFPFKDYKDSFIDDFDK